MKACLPAMEGKDARYLLCKVWPSLIIGSSDGRFLWDWMCFQWEFQDPKMEVLYHIRPYFAGIFPYIGLI